MKKKKSKEPIIPVARGETIRQKIISVLNGQTLSAKNLSAETGVPEKEIYEHLEHIQMSVSKRENPLIIVPAECKKCGFVFKKRDKLKKPGKCPVCRSELIQEPLFSIKKIT
ncbi:MAG: transcriptional regulator [Nitrospirae bacterium]|jgi:transcriptional regulator|nr:transcriptional regulator [Nitrospirota bacterium]